MDLDFIVANIARFTTDAVLVTEAEPVEDPGPRILWCNDAFTRMTGYSREETIGRSPRFLQGPGTGAAARRAIGNGLRRWLPVHVELLNYRKDGSEFWVDLAIQPVPDETGWFRYWVAIQRDVSAMRAERIELEREIDRLTVANEALQSFAATASHDLREPLRKIAVFADLLEAHLDVEDWAAARQAIAAIRTTARRANQLVTDILRLSSANERPIRRESFRPAAVVQEILDDFQPAIREYGVAVATDLPPVEIEGDRAAFDQIARNLIGNAIKHRHPERPPRLEITLEPRADGGTRVVFADNGDGIPEERRADIFRPFVTLNTIQPRSSGLGLSIVRSLTEKLGWLVDFESVVGVGTRFLLDVPGNPARLPEAAVAARPPER